MGKKKQKKSISVGTILSILFCVLIGVFFGVYLANQTPDGLTTGQVLTRRLWMLLLLYASIFLQTVIHEAGHLICGLVSGYRFVSFRIASFQWTLTEGRIRLSRHSVAGTAGQCLMLPPDLADGRIPVMLYNLGGALVNLISAGISLILFFAADSGSLVAFFCLSMAGFGVICALTNGIPMRLGTVDNDGYNALMLGKNKDAMRGFWLQLQINAQLAQGKRLKEMPEEWFTVPSEEAMGNSLVAAIGVCACNRLLDQNRYREADALMSHLLSIESGMIGLHRNMLLCDRMCCEMIGENRQEVIGALYTAELKNFMKSMKNNPSVIRTQYLYARLVERDPVKEAALLEKFEKVAKTYPYPNDMQADRELIAAAQRKTEREVLCNGQE